MGDVVLQLAMVLALLVSFAAIVRLALQGALLTRDRAFQSVEPARGGVGGVTVVVPMRNEERNIAACLDHLEASEYTDLRILVVDDDSSDRSAEIVAERCARPSSRARMIHLDGAAQREKEAWVTKKGFVVWRAAREVDTEWVLFVDADTRLPPDAVGKALTYVRDNALEAFSASGVYPHPQILGDVVESLMYLVLFVRMPLREMLDDDGRRAWMNGQFVLFRTGVYHRIGGHRAIARFAFDDMSLAHHAKREGVRFHFLPAAGLYECHNYVTLQESVREWSRLIAGGTPWLGVQRGFFWAGFGGMLLCCVLPFVWLPLLPWAGFEPLTNRLVLAQSGSVLGLFVLIRASMKLRVWPAVLLPVAAAICLWIVILADRMRFGRGRFRFRGRVFTPDDPSKLGEEVS